ncbi:hypothetical protein BKA69DRAFT_1099021 [Paraphysoderma sedebokerense]|nr:hypothetical protein BKA69DRAFT_1099021 [Paraphysoderma sedebokerense]
MSSTRLPSGENLLLSSLLNMETFQKFLANPTGCQRFLEYLSSEHSEENLRFYLSMARTKVIVEQLRTVSGDIARKYISDCAPEQINIDHGVKRGILQTIDGLQKATNDLSPVDVALKKIAQLMFTDSYRRFVKHQMLRYTQMQLDLHNQSELKDSLRGLADCYILTNPRLPDNPITHASDGFTELTGYKRDEMGKNCRFLQGIHTSHESIQRIKEALTTQREVTELLVNYRKNGEPFWNLLYIVPLLDERNEIRFFFGAQIDVSAAVNVESGFDLLLTNIVDQAIDDDAEVSDDEEEPQPSCGFFGRAFRSRRVTKTPLVKPLKKAETKKESQFDLIQTSARLTETTGSLAAAALLEQAETFYRTYSRFVVVSKQKDDISDEFPIAFISNVMNSQNKSAKNQILKCMRKSQVVSTIVKCQDKNGAVFRATLHCTPLKQVKTDAVEYWMVVFVWNVPNSVLTTLNTSGDVGISEKLLNKRVELDTAVKLT